MKMEEKPYKNTRKLMEMIRKGDLVSLGSKSSSKGRSKKIESKVDESSSDIVNYISEKNNNIFQAKSEGGESTSFANLGGSEKNKTPLSRFTR